MAPTRKARFKRHFLGLRPWTRHSVILLVAGTMYVFFGLSLIFTELTFAREEGLQIALQWFSIDVWGGIWIAVGSMAIISSRWPPALEKWGYMALSGLTTGWASGYLLGILFGTSPWTNINFVIVWSMVAFLWIAISGLLNPDNTGVGDHG